jgi:hypothetical protein
LLLPDVILAHSGIPSIKSSIWPVCPCHPIPLQKDDSLLRGSASEAHGDDYVDHHLTPDGSTFVGDATLLSMVECPKKLIGCYRLNVAGQHTQGRLRKLLPNDACHVVNKRMMSLTRKTVEPLGSKHAHRFNYTHTSNGCTGARNIARQTQERCALEFVDMLGWIQLRSLVERSESTQNVSLWNNQRPWYVSD